MSVATDEGVGSDADTLLNYTLQLVYGIDAPEQESHLNNLRRLSSRYIRELGDAIWQSPAVDGEQPSSQGNSYSSSTSSPADDGQRESQSGSSQASSKRKQEEDLGEDGGGNGQGAGFLPVKKAKHSVRDSGNLRLSCPFRQRNPQRFNVRDHHSCAMTYFPKFAELRYVNSGPRQLRGCTNNPLDSTLSNSTSATTLQHLYATDAIATFARAKSFVSTSDSPKSSCAI